MIKDTLILKFCQYNFKINLYYHYCISLFSIINVKTFILLRQNFKFSEKTFTNTIKELETNSTFLIPKPMLLFFRDGTFSRQISFSIIYNYLCCQQLLSTLLRSCFFAVLFLLSPVKPSSALALPSSSLFSQWLPFICFFV